MEQRKDQSQLMQILNRRTNQNSLSRYWGFHSCEIDFLLLGQSCMQSNLIFLDVSMNMLKSTGFVLESGDGQLSIIKKKPLHA